jgi:hypothetical protein
MWFHPDLSRLMQLNHDLNKSLTGLMSDSILKTSVLLGKIYSSQNNYDISNHIPLLEQQVKQPS